MTGQRGITAILYVVLLILGALAGRAGQFPVVALDVQVVTPEFVYDLLIKIITPTVLLIMVIKGVFEAINGRVSAEALSPGDLTPLLTMPEFWLGAVGSVVYIIQVFFKVTIIDEATQAILANAIMAVISQLVTSWGARSPGQSPTGNVG